MGILDKFNEMMERQRQKKLEQRVKEVESVYDSTRTEEEGINEASRKVIELMKEDPELGVRILETIQESQKLPNKVVVEAIKQIPETEQIGDPEKTIIETVEKLPLETEEITDIIKESKVSIPVAKEITKQIPNEQVRKEEKDRLEQIEKEASQKEQREREKEILKDLREKYVTCDKIEGTQLTSQLSEIRKKMETTKVKDAISQVLARKAAIEWKQLGTTRLPSMYKVITPQEMIEIDFPDLVEQEYEDIKDKKQYAITKEYEFDKKNLQKLILKEMAKQIAEVYKEYGIIEIPQTIVDKKFDEEVENYFAEKIMKYGEDINNEEMVINKIKGINNYELEDLIGMIEKLPEAEKSECLKDFKKQIVERKQNAKENNQDEKESNSNKENIEKKENRDDEYIH